LASSVACGLPL